MKKVLLTVFAALTVFVASAQIEQGTWLLSGASDLSFVSNNEDAGDDSQFDVNVRGGYFVIENLAIGLNLGVSKWSEADDATIGVGPFARYYFAGKVFGGAGINIIKMGDFSATQIPLEVGYAAFLNKVVAIEPSLNYGIYGGDLEGAAFGVNVGISVYLGRGE
jgi:outer membrane protein